MTAPNLAQMSRFEVLQHRKDIARSRHVSQERATHWSNLCHSAARLGAELATDDPQTSRYLIDLSARAGKMCAQERAKVINAEQRAASVDLWLSVGEKSMSYRDLRDEQAESEASNA